MQIPETENRHPLGPMLDDRIAAGGDVARLAMNAPRYWIALGAWLALGGFLIYLALSAGTLLSTIVGAIGLGLMYGAIRTLLSGRQELILTLDSLSDTRGRIVARVDDVQKVDRGTFSLRPSNGFGIQLKAPGARGWQPGLWWCTGRRIGIGGLTPSGQGRAMADLLDAMVQDRKAQASKGR